MDHLLFESVGGMQKRKGVLQLFCGVFVICGVLIMFLGIAAPSYDEKKMPIILAGMAIMVLGMYIWQYIDNHYTSKAYLRIYQDHVEGRQLAPDQMFTLKLEEILFVKKDEMNLDDLLIIETEQISYTVPVDNVKRAYELINQRLDEIESI